MPGEGAGVSADEVDRGGAAAPAPPGGGEGAQSGAEDVSDAVHEGGAKGKSAS